MCPNNIELISHYLGSTLIHTNHVTTCDDCVQKIMLIHTLAIRMAAKQQKRNWKILQFCFYLVMVPILLTIIYLLTFGG